ncbi:MAG: hypothetical protein GY810_14495 [Aureispira sp.]|nr:hypothetical protein [Aureispira sp.]
MNLQLKLDRQLILFLIPLGILMGLVTFINSPLFQEHSNILSIGVTIDLLVSIPIVYYLIIRKTSIPKTTVVPIMVIGLIVGTYYLPPENQNYLTLFKTWILPIIELSIFTFIVLKIRTVIKKYNSLKSEASDFFTSLKEACQEILPQKIVLPFATEIAVIYYGFINWKPSLIGENEFSYHKKSGTPVLLGTLIFMIAIETVALHLLLMRWNEVIAWILAILSTYTAIQILGFTKSLKRCPIRILDNKLVLRYGILAEVEIPFEDISKIELSREPIIQDTVTSKLSPLGDFESHNVLIHLKRENIVVGVYGIKKKFKILGLHIDDETKFKEKIEGVLTDLSKNISK